MMERALKIKEQLDIEKMVCVYDPTGIQLKEPKMCSSLFLMMGTFHVLLKSLSVIGARFKDAGMRNLYIQSEIVAEGCIDSVLKGKQYNRAIRAHKKRFAHCI